MKTILLASALAIASSGAFAQEATMDPAVIEEAAASSDAGLIVPLLTLLIVIAALSGGSNTPLPPT